MKNRAWCDFQRILCKKESDVNVLIWTNFAGFANAYLI